MDLSQLSAVLHNQPQYRWAQVKQLIYQQLISDWAQATVLPKALIAELSLHCPLNIEVGSVTATGNSSKALLTLADGLQIETVLINNADSRQTVCVSSQVGCALGCQFCATGALGFKRNLSSQEIVEQVLYFARQLKAQDQKIDNLVFMGMGEPLLNIDNVLEAIKIINDPDGLNLGSRRISISTVGLKPGLDKIIKSGLQVNLAISLHGADDEVRARLMPIHKSTSLKELFKLVANYVERTNRQVMFEYILLPGVNDSEDDAQKLIALMTNRKLYMINLIQYNDTGVFKPSTELQMKTFQNILLKAGLKTTVRYSRGSQIQAACGQLANTEKNTI